MGQASNDYNKALQGYFVVLGMCDFRSFPFYFFSQHCLPTQVRKGEGGSQRKRSDPRTFIRDCQGLGFPQSFLSKLRWIFTQGPSP